MEGDESESEYTGEFFDYRMYYECDEAANEQFVKDVIEIYISPVLLFIGSFGNFLSFVIMYRFSFQVLSTCIYFCLLAVVDLLVLYTRCGNVWFTSVTHLDLSETLMVSSESVCKVYPFVFNFLFHLSKWLMVCVAVEGFIATRYPEKADKMCSLSRAKAIVLFLTVILVCVNIHFFWSYELISIKDLDHTIYYFCTFAKDNHQQSELFQSTIWPALDTLLAEVIPCCVIIICGVVMLVQIIKGKHRGDQRHQNWKQRYQLHASAMDELQITILVVCVLFLALTLPQFGFQIVKFLVSKYGNSAITCHTDAQFELARTACKALEHCFLSSKVIMYFCTSAQFRRECKKICVCCFRCLRRQVIHPSASKAQITASPTTSPVPVKSVYASRLAAIE